MTRTHNPVAPKSVAFAIAIIPSRAAVFDFDRNRILQIAEHDVDLPSEFARLGPQLFNVRRHEMNHALEPGRQFEQRTRRADGERVEDFARGFHGSAFI